jgi:poly-beta-1,6-N-acetyl-D-glucosamine synthase
METLFFILLFVIFYTYLGYGIVMFGLVKIKRKFNPRKDKTQENYFPAISLLIPTFNEMQFLPEKINNCLSLDYPKDKLHVIFVTDGSTDGSPDYIKNEAEIHPNWQVFHLPERRGKIAAMNRAMAMVKTPISIFCDANTLINADAIKKIVRHFADPEVGCVAGEKRVKMDENSNAAGTEGIYWKYESFLKKLDSEFHSVVGAAGELFAVRTELYTSVRSDLLLDDFVVSLEIAEKGFRVVYEPNAFALETPVTDIREEVKRKIRISAGGIQSIIILLDLLNIFKYRWLSFQYISHRVLRWTITPLSLPLVLVINVALAFQNAAFYLPILICQIVFYMFAWLGYLLNLKKIKVKILFVPMYFTLMNVCVFIGFYRYLIGKQTVIWHKANR